jgi:hypothetical protein
MYEPDVTLHQIQVLCDLTTAAQQLIEEARRALIGGVIMLDPEALTTLDKALIEVHEVWGW